MATEPPAPPEQPQPSQPGQPIRPPPEVSPPVPNLDVPSPGQPDTLP